MEEDSTVGAGGSLGQTTTTVNDFRDSSNTQIPGTGLFGDIQVPYIVIIWVVALASSVFSIALCCLCSHLKKRASRLRHGNRQETGQDTKDHKQNQTPIKIANPLSCRDSCAICCEPYTAGQNDPVIGYIRLCGHYFHHACAWRWIAARETCPLCRNPVNLRKHEMTPMTLNELEALLGVPSGTLRREKHKEKTSLSDDTSGRLKTISLTMNLPVVLTSSEVTGVHTEVAIVHSDNSHSDS